MTNKEEEASSNMQNHKELENKIESLLQQNAELETIKDGQ